jgi:lipopolysaccharide transport system permease protein
MYPISVVPEKYRILLYLNPLTSLVQSFQWVFLHEGDLPRIGYFLISIVVALVIWFSGAIAFRAMENKVADVM